MKRFLANLASTALVQTIGRFLRGRSGTSAVEFALVSPILIAILIPLSDLGSMMTSVDNMETAVRASTQYALKGGTDMTVARNEGIQAWTAKPSGGTLSAQQFCKCGTTSNVCTTPCPDGSYPLDYVAVTATATLGGTVLSENKTVTQTVRVQ